ncbi:MAG: ribosome recycling factor [Candidatus Loosdrechtia sp.]|uniref:ribosome-recycling factor n=1 Tax=Candidatus Loosdrechtia sp. TaxID=3101272 RepID=UPI003A60D120|nr:MAG: ribosome recycling factor [Candidatus Jettenia sp. AMX2]
MSKESICKDARVKMEKAVAHLQEELRGLRTGRASAGLVENLRVECYGDISPLRQLAAITTPDAQSIVIKPYDPSVISNIEKAILKSDLSLTPAVEGKALRISIPPLTEERRKKLSAHAKEISEATKVALRNVRHEAIKNTDKEEKESILTEDDAKRTKDEIQKIIHEYEKKVTDIVKKKMDEILKL